MKKILCVSILTFAIGGYAQWTPINNLSKKRSDEKEKYYKLDLDVLRNQLNKNIKSAKTSQIEISIPTDGKIERFVVYSNPVVVPSLAERYQLGSYEGVGVDNPNKKVRFSISPYGFQAMIQKGGRMEFLDPIDVNSNIYSLHLKKGRKTSKKPFCTTKEHEEGVYNNKESFRKNKTFLKEGSDGVFRTLRLAISTTGEYTSFFGGVPQAIAAVNATITRVNAIFERDFSTKLILQDFPELIFSNPKTDPYSDTKVGVDGQWSEELMNTLHTTIGDDSFDIGHLFSSEGGGGFAGNIGNVCSNDRTEQDGIYYYKGTGFTSPDEENDMPPYGDEFDIDFVAHEMAHQLGANHTFSYVLEGTGMNVEPGSGSTIMGYAGISTADVQLHSDSYFHSVSIEQVLKTLQNTTCDREVQIKNTAPSIKPLRDKTIPKETAFVLTAEAIDNEADKLTYVWEQIDNAESPIVDITGEEETGALFRSLPPTEQPMRFFPKFDRVLKGSLTNSSDWESVAKIPRETNFSITVRDNHKHKEEQQLSIAKQRISVGEDGPFRVINAEVYNNAPTPINWSVVNTDRSPYNVANVKIDYSKDDGKTWEILLASTPNDGTEVVSLPSSLPLDSKIFIRVSAIDNVFYALNSARVTTVAECTDGSEIKLSYSYATKNSVQISWGHMAGASYVLRYKLLSEEVWKEQNLNGNFAELTGLKEGSVYEVQVAPVCGGIQKSFSKISLFSTVSELPYCKVSIYSSEDEYISNVTLANLNNDSEGNEYTDYATDMNKLVRLEVGENYTLSVKTAWQDRNKPNKKAIKAWIDFNRNGKFEDDELLLNPKTTDTEETISVGFRVPDNAVMNKILKMRIMMKYDEIDIKPCRNYSFGEVEDYAVVVAPWQNILTTAPVVFPNAVDSILRISNIPDKTPYKIYDMSGRLIKQGIATKSEVFVQGLQSAVYVISFDYKGKTHSIRFIKK